MLEVSEDALELTQIGCQKQHVISKPQIGQTSSSRVSHVYPKTFLAPNTLGFPEHVLEHCVEKVRAERVALLNATLDVEVPAVDIGPHRCRLLTVELL